MLQFRKRAAIVQNCLEFAIAQTVGVSLRHPIRQSILRRNTGILLRPPISLERLAIMAVFRSAFRQIPPALGTVRRNIGQNGYLLRYLASPP